MKEEMVHIMRGDVPAEGMPTFERVVTFWGDARDTLDAVKDIAIRHVKDDPTIRPLIEVDEGEEGLPFLKVSHKGKVLNYFFGTRQDPEQNEFMIVGKMA